MKQSLYSKPVFLNHQMLRLGQVNNRIYLKPFSE